MGTGRRGEKAHRECSRSCRQSRLERCSGRGTRWPRLLASFSLKLEVWFGRLFDDGLVEFESER